VHKTFHAIRPVMTRRMLITGLAAMLLVADLRAQTRIQVVVRGDAGRDGWIDPNSGLAASARDLSKHVASTSRRWIGPATSETSAHVLVDILERHMEDAGELHVVTARVKVGDYEQPVTGRSDSNWRDAALSVAKQIDTWANANRERILAPRR
jgi:hypothetical protein